MQSTEKDLKERAKLRPNSNRSFMQSLISMKATCVAQGNSPGRLGDALGITALEQAKDN